MATPFQSIDPALLALQTAKKAMPASPSTQQKKKPVLQSNIQQSQAPFATSSVTPTKIGGISSPFGAANINSSPVLWWATPIEIKETATQLQSLPKAIPQTGTSEDIRSRLSTMGGDIVLRGKGLAEIKTAYPEFAHIDDETFKKIGGDIALRGKGIDDILRDYPELQQKINTKEKTTAQQIATPFVRFARWVADVWAWIQEGIDTWLSKLWILPDQTAINKKARVKDEEMTQQILGKKAWYEQYVQEWWRIAWSFIANAPANKLWTAGKMALWAAEWLLWWATYNLSTGEWVWSPVNLWLSTAIGAVVPWIVPAFKAIKWLSKEPSIRTAFAESLREWARTNVAKALAPTWKKYKQLTDRLTDEFLDRGLRWSKESLLQSAKEWVEKFWAKIDDAIAWWALDNVEIPTQPLKELLQEAKKSVMVWWNVVNTAKAKVIDWLEEVLTPFQNTIGWKEARRFKQILDEIVYSTKGGIWVEDMTYKNILSKWMADVLRKELSEAAPDLAKLNKDFSFYKSLEDVLEATMLRQRPQQWAVRKFIAWAFAGNQEWVVNKVIGYVWSKLFLDATSWATRNTLSAVAKNKLANAIATGSPKIINSVVQEMNDTHWLWLPLYDDVAVWAGNTMLKWTNIANTPKPTPKTPPITVEKWAIGMWTPKVNNTPVITPKATVAPSVWAPKVDTFKRMTELDSNPLYRKIVGGEILWWGKIKQWLFETPLWTITNEIMDGKVKKYIVNWKTYNTSDLWGIREKQAPEVVAQANKASKAISDLKAIESWKGNVMWSSLRSVLDDLWIKDVNSIPEWTEADILQMVRSRKPVAPKKWMPKLWKEIMEQNITKTDDLISEAKKYKSAEELWLKVKEGGHILDSLKSKENTFAKIDSAELGKTIKLDIRDLEKQKTGKLQSDYWLKKIKSWKRPPILVGIEDWKLKVIDGNHRASAYLQEKIRDVPIILTEEAKGNLKQIREQANKKPLPPLPKKWK